MQYNKKNESLVIGLSLFFVWIFAIFIICEISMRIIGKIKDIDFRLYLKELKNSERLPEDLFIPDRILGYRLNPNTQVLATTSDFSVIYKINSRGLRDKEYGYEKSKNKIRILAFGDSLTFGEGIEYGKRFTDITEDYFSNLEIINFGIPGYGLDQELLYIMREGIKYSPNYVILFINKAQIKRYSRDIIKDGFIVLPDFVNTLFENPVNNSTTIYLNRGDPFFRKNSNFFLKNSYFLSYLNYQICLIQLKNKLLQNDKIIWDKKRKRSIFTLDGEKRAEIIIRKFNDTCNTHGIKFIIINIGKVRSLGFLKAISSNIECYDLSDELKNESKKYCLSFVYDKHYNKRTHNFIAKKIIKILNKHIFNKNII